MVYTDFIGSIYLINNMVNFLVKRKFKRKLGISLKVHSPQYVIQAVKQMTITNDIYAVKVNNVCNLQTVNFIFV